MKLFLWSICLLGVLVYKGSCLQVRYDGDQVLKITPQTSAQAQLLQELTSNWLLDLWNPDMVEDISTLREVHVRVPFSYVDQMKEKLLQQAIPFTVMINDVQKLIDKSTRSKSNTLPMSLENYDYKQYHPMEEIYEWMEHIKEKHSDLVSQHYLGNTYEKRPIYYFKIGWPSDKQKKLVVMDCGIHAREWIAVAFCQWFVKVIIEKHQNDPILTNALKQVDFYIIPVLNVDGYIYSWTHERLWRKNRSPQGNGTCYGVDLNRNFNSQWCSVGASRNCSSFTFCGPEPASELETKALVALMEPVKSNILSYLTIHSYGQYILLPFGYTYQPSENHAELTKVAETAAAKIKGVHNKIYTVGSSSVVLYNNSGSSADWAGDLKIKLSYTFELRDNGTYGFQLPPDQIAPTCEENTVAVMSIIEYLNENYLENNAVVVSSVWLNVILSCAICMYFTLTH
ncbi:carboxypeptidase O-like [Spea bombifrons]|uniref:carboxypeptidase O-like n=1 Tax=Spea bombifrons TaxID=233779 RepID=UPI00234B855F|nr:carboxypeptidase O-like [Spea bombifrons]